MKLIIQIGAIALITYLLMQVFPWWTIVIVPFLVSLAANEKGGRSFLAGFTGIFLLWFVHTWVISMQSGSLMTQKIAALFGLPNTFLLMIITALIGGLCGGLGAWSGFHARALFAGK